jgi:diadenosine tetraphosphate (Ap4A) HIT family hydrolase
MCLTCSIVAGDLSPIGGIIYKDDHVILHHCIDINIPGYLIISPLIHVEAYSDLHETEILHMGIITKLAVATLKKLDGVEKVYVANFGEETAHFHMHIFPRYKWMLNYSAEDIYTDHKLDGARLLSFCRRQHKIMPDLMQNNDIIAVIKQIRKTIGTPAFI